METESMEYRSLGQSGLKVSVLGFGNMVSGWREDTQAWSFECISKCINAGVNFFDTAQFYGFGVAQTVLGRNIKQGEWDRDDLIISDKLNPVGFGMQGLSRKRMRAGLDKALERLQMDAVDVLFLHRYDHQVPLEEQIRAVNQYIDDDKAYYWGTSEFTPQQLLEVHRICDKYGLIHPIVEQCQYNMFYRDVFEREYALLYDQYGMGTTIWSPLASGLLAGKYNDGSAPDQSRFATTEFSLLKWYWNMMMVEKRDNTLRILNGLKDMATEIGCSQSQLAIAWTIANKDVSTCLLGASNPSQLDDTLVTCEIAKKLTPEVLQKIEDLLGNRPDPTMNWRIFSPNEPRR